jgi:hypothetical protein
MDRGALICVHASGCDFLMITGSPRPTPDTTQRLICLTTSQRKTPRRVCDNVSMIGASVSAKRDVVGVVIVGISFVVSFHR